MNDARSTGNTWDTEIDVNGAFIREPTEFRNCISTETGSEFQPDMGRYHLYVSYACPWAHRTLITRKLKGLEDVVSVDVVAPFLSSTGWSFDDSVEGATGDRENNYSNLQEVYFAAKENFAGTITVPVLWDKKNHTIVNNESAEIIRLFNSEFQALAKHPELDLYPQPLREEIESLNDWIFPEINNGVYRCGFARSQEAYNDAFRRLFAALDRVESLLQERRYLTGDQLTEADVRLFTTLVRFDAVYSVHFKCNLRHIVDYSGMWRFVRDIYNLPGVAETVNMEHIKLHYYQSHTHINPFGIVPLGPLQDFSL